MRTLGIDTSNYTTSVAAFDGADGYNAGRLLRVRQGTLGLRQSDALFQHVKALPDRFSELHAAGWLDGISAVAASTRPRAIEGSYMPCFLAGESQGRAMAQTLGVPFYAVSHQQGHLSSAAWSAGRMDLLDKPFLAWHLSGGTTELLYVTPDDGNVQTKQIGGTSDISAGQLIDRTGVMLGMEFPAGKAVDALAATRRDYSKRFSVKRKDFTFSLSGIENQVKTMVQESTDPGEICRFVLNTIADIVRRTTLAALEQYHGLPVLCSGGVASNTFVRSTLEVSCGAIFAQPRYAADNALGVAILAYRLNERGRG